MSGGSARAQELNLFVILGHPHGAAGLELERWPQPHHHFHPICTVMNMVAIVGCMCLRTSSMVLWSISMTDKIACCMDCIQKTLQSQLSRMGSQSGFQAVCSAPVAGTVVCRRRGGVRGGVKVSSVSSLKDCPRLLMAVLPDPDGASSGTAPTQPGLGGVP